MIIRCAITTSAAILLLTLLSATICSSQTTTESAPPTSTASVGEGEKVLTREELEQIAAEEAASRSETDHALRRVL